MAIISTKKEPCRRGTAQCPSRVLAITSMTGKWYLFSYCVLVMSCTALMSSDNNPVEPYTQALSVQSVLCNGGH